jgi:hypothetical protein
MKILFIWKPNSPFLEALSKISSLGQIMDAAEFYGIAMPPIWY